MNKYESSRIRNLFLRQLRKLKEDRDAGSLRVMAGISGGPDSMAMLYCLHREGIETTAVHINYGLRGADSDKDQKLVEEISSLWNIDCISVNLGGSLPKTGNFQNWAREERYRIFGELMNETGSTVVATAHHLNDQIETIFQKILRGSGMGAWKAMSAIQGMYFRPLIHAYREDIIKFVSDFNIPYRIDRSNEESTYARNFIRNKWFPQLDGRFPGWQKNVLSLQERAKEYELLLAEKAETISIDDSSFSRHGFLEADPVLQPAILKYLFQKKFPGVSISKKALRQVQSVSELQTGAALQLTAGIALLRDRDHYVFIKKQENFTDSNQLDFNELSDNVNIKIDSLCISLQNYSGKIEQKKLQMDASKIEFPMTIRTWNNADRFTPFGMEGTQLVSDHLTNRKISAEAKKKAKVVESFDGKVAAVIFPGNKGRTQPGTISEMVRCTTQTTQIVTIEKNL